MKSKAFRLRLQRTSYGPNWEVMQVSLLNVDEEVDPHALAHDS